MLFESDMNCSSFDLKDSLKLTDIALLLCRLPKLGRSRFTHFARVQFYTNHSFNKVMIGRKKTFVLAVTSLRLYRVFCQCSATKQKSSCAYLLCKQ